ncbi:hypothetical protein DC3_30750 [Deinococcus cellulosilyticus NBRC 106333 = KACC 11606]|uniref:Uncharacterized protein n=1 Tax=Deinococcus cellulosilyticus (strain DSM 18568 / NBRC 106333 / KACC 11606 / 5516J-15) TaxID=1223518 RepID=A0A511N3J5_DEIC1|nr:hypothetical protein DC3_30750 [Deinococcus cellulosilyticus NBRC 106333 = KACC 11606]
MSFEKAISSQRSAYDTSSLSLQPDKQMFDPTAQKNPANPWPAAEASRLFSDG